MRPGPAEAGPHHLDRHARCSAHRRPWMASGPVVSHPMAERPPLWMQGFNAIERQIGPRLESVIQSEPFAVAVGLVANVQRTVQRQVTRSTRRWLHLWNLPAGTDV